ncbi:MAG: class I SAM-dependent methyltransferase [Solirubrobacteraceae bacterium]
MITGERVTTARAGFNPTFQRHVAAYRLCASLLGDGRVLDLGCGVGHSYRELLPRVTVGVDLDAAALAGQGRETVLADMRRLPLADESFQSVLSVQSLEHVPDPERALAEVVRVLEPGGRAIFVTPNRLTFGRPDEIIDPYHYVEYDAAALRELCAPFFAAPDVRGIDASDRYRAIYDEERRELDRLLARDPLRLRRLIPRRLRQRLYDWRLRADRATPRAGALEIEPGDFWLSEQGLEHAFDLVVICDKA